MFRVLFLVVVTCSSVLAQQIYITTSGPTARPQCPASSVYSTPTYSISSFSFTQNETVRTATSAPSPTTNITYAPAYTDLSHLLPNLSTTSWGSWDPNATTSATDTDNMYGQAAWTALWERADITNYTATGLYSTTVSPTPVPSSELVLPPRDYFGPTDCYYFPEDFIFGVSGSAAQIEGAIAREGRTPTLMEKLGGGNEPTDHTTNENYYLYKQDIERIAAMGVQYYSFSIAWTRILPFAVPGTPVNSLGLQHYDDLINYVLEKGKYPWTPI